MPDAVLIDNGEDARWVVWAVIGVVLAIIVGLGIGIYLTL